MVLVTAVGLVCFEVLPRTGLTQEQVEAVRTIAADSRTWFVTETPLANLFLKQKQNGTVFRISHDFQAVPQ